MKGEGLLELEKLFGGGRGGVGHVRSREYSAVSRPNTREIIDWSMIR